MIKKVIKIKNVGKFKDFSASGDISFDKTNIIYGENSTGKTTLTSIIRSLILNNSELISERRSFGSNKDQYVELLFENNKLFKFKDMIWNERKDDLENIEIFDEFFINKNISTGMDILSEHQKCLYGFAIGKEGVALAKEIEKIKNDLKTNKYSELNSLEEQIKRLSNGCFEVKEFVDLPENKKIDKKLEERKREINIVEKSAEIKEKGYLKNLPILTFKVDFIELKNLLKKSLVPISGEALRKTTEHINKLVTVIGKEAEEWIHQGLSCVENTKDNKCPFCQQDLNNAKTTIESYQQYFNEEYRKLKEDINKYSGQIERLNIEQSLSNIKSVYLTNIALIEFWINFLTFTEFPELKNLDQYNEKVVKLFKNIKLLIKKKSESILESIDTSNRINKLSELVKTLDKEIYSYNSKVEICNEEIKKLKEKQLDITKLKDDLKKLKIQKKRYSEEAVALCNKYTKCKNEIENSKKLVGEKKKDLKKEISQKVEKYGKKTNEILEKFGSPFKIVQQTSRYRGQGEEPYYEYFLEMEGSAAIDPLKKAKFTLSSGDRNALALAFFLAKIYIAPSIEHEIIIFDDPITSFDFNRKRRTIEFIINLSQNAKKQTIILTHLNTFAFELHDSLKDIHIKPKCLQIINGDIKKWDINEEKKHPFFKNLSRLESFLNYQEETPIEEARRLIRICLEDKLKFGYFQFFKDLGNEYWLGDIVKKFRDLKDDKKLRFKHHNKEEVIEELGNLCDFSSPSHHSNISTPYKTDYTQTEIVNYVKSTLKLIYKWL